MTEVMTTEIVRRKVADLKPHPANPRKLDQKSPEVKAMEESIKQHGLMQLPAIDENGQILAGERRWRAIKNLGWTEVDCVVLSGLDAGEAVLALLAANTSVQAHDPFLQSNAINDMLKSGVSVNRIAEKLGKTLKWVAQHSALAGLNKAIRKMWDDGHLPGWDANMLAAIAVLSTEDQQALCPKAPGHWSTLGNLKTIEDVESLIANVTHSLAKAPWDLNDATLDPKAGSCMTCPSQSMRQPGLFDDGKCTNIKDAKCLAPACWARKLALTAKAKAAAMGEGTKIIVADPNKVPDIANPLRDFQVRVVEKDARNSEKALLVTETGALKVVAIEKPRVEKAKKAEKKDSAAVEKDPKQRYADSIDQIGRRRKAFVVDKVRDTLAGMETPESAVVMTLVAAFGCRGSGTHLQGVEFAELGDAQKDNDTWAKEVYPRVVPLIEEALKRWNPSNLESELALASWLCRKLQLNEALFYRQAEEEIPDPKWWASYSKKEEKAREGENHAVSNTLAARAVGKKGKAAKAKPKAKAKKKA